MGRDDLAQFKLRNRYEGKLVLLRANARDILSA